MTPDLKQRLDRQYEQFNDAQSVTDPIQIVRRFQRPDDVEIVAVCASALAFGRVQSVLNSINGLVTVMGSSPADYVRACPPERDRGALDPLGHRWTRGVALAALVWILRQMLDSHGSIEALFVDGSNREAETIEKEVGVGEKKLGAILKDAKKTLTALHVELRDEEAERVCPIEVGGEIAENHVMLAAGAGE